MSETGSRRPRRVVCTPGVQPTMRCCAPGGLTIGSVVVIDERASYGFYISRETFEWIVRQSLELAAPYVGAP